MLLCANKTLFMDTEIWIPYNFHVTESSDFFQPLKKCKNHSYIVCCEKISGRSDGVWGGGGCWPPAVMKSDIKSFHLNVYLKTEKAAMETNIISNRLQVESQSALRGLNLLSNKAVADLTSVSDAGQSSSSSSSGSRGHCSAIFHICFLVKMVLAISCFLKNF